MNTGKTRKMQAEIMSQVENNENNTNNIKDMPVYGSTLTNSVHTDLHPELIYHKKDVYIHMTII